MVEPSVTLTDYALTAECALFCALMARGGDEVGLRRWWLAFFVSIGAASLIGGTVHGFVPDVGSTTHAVLWKSTLLLLGVTSSAAWIIGAHMVFRETIRAWVARGATIVFVAYAATVLFVSSRFLLAIMVYLPATAFLTVAMGIAYRREPQRPLVLGITGLMLTFVAAAVQQMRITIHPVYFNHNALYHLIQGVALFLVFRSTSARLSSAKASAAFPAAR